MTLGRHLKMFWVQQNVGPLSRNHQSLPSSLSTLKSKARPKNNHQDIVTSFHLLKNQVDWKKMSELRIFLCDKVNFLENKPFGQIRH